MATPSCASTVPNVVSRIRLPLSVLNGRPQLRPSSQRLDRPAGRFPEEGQHLDRDGAPPQTTNQFALVGDQDKAPAGNRDNLLAQQRTSASFEAVDGRVDLIGAVDGQIEGTIDPLGGRDLSFFGESPALRRSSNRPHLETRANSFR